MVRGRGGWVGWLLVLAGLLGAGCSSTYMRNRGRDAVECIDWGFVTTKKPHFAIFNDYFNVVPLGYSNLEGTFHGIGNGRCGSMPIRIQYWGALAWGGMAFQLGEFDPDSPFQASPEEVAAQKAAGHPLETTPWHNIGFVRLAMQDNGPPRRTGFM